MAIGQIVNVALHSDLQWWLTPENQKWENALAAFRFIENNDISRLQDYKVFTRIYENRDYVGLMPGNFSRRRTATERSTFNVTKAVIDTVSSKIAKTRPHARFQTFGGNYGLRRRARLLEQYVEAAQYRTGYDNYAREVFKDTCVYGTGVMKIYSDGTEIRAERVFPAEVFVDQAEGWDGEPRQIFRRKWVDRQVLKALFPQHAEWIEDLNASQRAEWGFTGQDSLADQIEVIEVIRLPSKRGKGDGHHLIFVDGGTLYSGPWEHSTFPYVFVRWTKTRRGFWGIGLVEELLGIQVEINRLLARINKSLRYGNFQVWLDHAARIKGQTMTNEIGSINFFRGTPPHFVTPNTVSPEVFMHLDRLYSKAFELAGISMESAAGVNQLGADASGVARREFHDLNTERFAMVARDWERAHMDAAKIYVELAKELASKNSDFKVVAAKDRNTISSVKWSEVEMDEDSYVLRVAPASALPSLPAARLQSVSDLMMLGLIDPQEGKRMLDFPDVDAHMALDRAASENIDRIIEQILDDGVYEAPEPFMDFQLALKKFQAAYQKAVMDEVPEENLILMRQFMAATNELMQRATMAQQMPMMAAQPGVPPAPGPTGQAPMAVTPQDGTVPF